MSSRCSYEIVEKSAKRGIKAIVSISGPTAFALRKANEANITLYSLDKNRVIEIKL
jgi:formate dehydrogenase accessory protein FdhD